MSRLVFAALLVSLVGTASLPAEEAAAFRPSQRRRAIEKTLDAPLNWELGGREQITLAELIHYVHEQHGLQIRWDAVSLRLFFGEQSLFGDLLGTSPGLQAYYSPSQCPTGDLATCPGTPQPLVTFVQTQPQPVNSQPTQSYPSAGAPVPYSEPTSQAPPANNGINLPVPPAPPLDEGASDNLVPQSAANPVLDNQVPPPNHDATPADQLASDNMAASGPDAMIAKYLSSPISLSSVALQRATVREGLQQLLDAVSSETSVIPLSIGIPLTSRALALELMVDENSVLITTQLRANAAKETRVYRLGALSEMSPDVLERVITHSIRPWSWRKQANEIAQQLVSRWPKTSLPLPKIELNATDGIKLMPAEEGTGEAPSSGAKPHVSEEMIAATGQLVAGGAVAMVHSIVAALEIVHHGDPPTGVIESLPGMLIITQSQAAHREIKELLDELSEGQ